MTKSTRRRTDKEQTATLVDKTKQRGQALLELLVSINILLAAFLGLAGAALYFLEVGWAENIAFRCALCGLEGETGSDCQARYNYLSRKRLVFRYVDGLTPSGDKKKGKCELRLSNSRLPEVLRKWFPEMTFKHEILLADLRNWHPWARYDVPIESSEPPLRR